MVSSIDHLASGAGVAVMRKGGNAIDAAIATSAVLAVTSQHMCGMGGDLFALIHRAGDGEPAVLNASGRSGSGADAARLRAEGVVRMPRRGDIRCVPVPGCVDGWLALHERFGSLPIADILEPARDYAADGFPCSPTLTRSVRSVINLADAADYLNDGRPPKPGTVIRRPGVARALDAIIKRGRAGFYEGEFGEGLLALGRGEYAPSDLEEPNADWVRGVHTEAFGRRLWTIPPNSQGYLTLAGAWIADGLDLPQNPDESLWAHLLVGSRRQAAWDRIDVLHEHADGEALLAPQRLAPRRAAIHPERAAALGGDFGGGGTIYMCTVDSEGTGVSLIQSNFAGFGSGLIVPGVRIFLQNRGAGFPLRRDTPPNMPRGAGHPTRSRPRSSRTSMDNSTA